MKYNLIVRPEAEQDIEEAFGWYEDRISGLGQEFLRSIDAAFAQLSRSPGTYPAIYRNIRRVLIRRFPFGVFYFISEEKIIVLAVLHARRDPRLWEKQKRPAEA